MNTFMPASYDVSFVALSFAISLLGAFLALTAVSSMQAATTGRSRRMNLLAASVALGGIGIWSMHFIGMLSLRNGMGMSYSIPETLASLVAAIAACWLALSWIARGRGLPRLLGAGAMLGTAVLVMHYLGMYGMRFNGFFQWSTDLVGLSVAIAYVAATAGLWLAFRGDRVSLRAGASVVIALAVCAMHYTGMAAAGFICTSPNPPAFPSGDGLVTSLQLPVVVTMLSLGMAFLIALDQFFQRFSDRAPAPRPQPSTFARRA